MSKYKTIVKPDNALQSGELTMQEMQSEFAKQNAEVVFGGITYDNLGKLIQYTMHSGGISVAELAKTIADWNPAARGNDHQILTQALAYPNLDATAGLVELNDSLRHSVDTDPTVVPFQSVRAAAFYYIDLGQLANAFELGALNVSRYWNTTWGAWDSTYSDGITLPPTADVLNMVLLQNNAEHNISFSGAFLTLDGGDLGSTNLTATKEVTLPPNASISLYMDVEGRVYPREGVLITSTGSTSFPLRSYDDAVATFPGGW